jgi:hypothetical protein
MLSAVFVLLFAQSPLPLPLYPCSFRPGGLVASNRKTVVVDQLQFQELDSDSIECDPGIVKVGSTLELSWQPDGGPFTATPATLVRIHSLGEGDIEEGLRRLDHLEKIVHNTSGGLVTTPLLTSLVRAHVALLRRAGRLEELSAWLGNPCQGVEACLEERSRLDREWSSGISFSDWQRVGTMPALPAPTLPPGCAPDVYWHRGALCVGQNETASVVRCFDPTKRQWGPAHAGPTLPRCSNDPAALAGTSDGVLMVDTAQGFLEQPAKGAGTRLDEAGLVARLRTGVGSQVFAGKVRCQGDETNLWCSYLTGPPRHHAVALQAPPDKLRRGRLLVSPDGGWMLYVFQLVENRNPDCGKFSSSCPPEPGSPWELWLAKVSLEARP